MDDPNEDTEWYVHDDLFIEDAYLCLSTETAQPSNPTIGTIFFARAASSLPRTR